MALTLPAAKVSQYTPPVTPADLVAIDAHVREIDQDGLTVLAPDLLGAIAPECADLPGRLREALVRLETGGKAVRRQLQSGVLVVEVRDLLEQDPVFREATVHPAILALAEARLGEGFRVRSCSPLIQPTELADVSQLHCDGAPQLGTAVLSCVWVLSEFDRPRGTLCYVPGSHRLRRMPGRAEGTDELLAVEVPPGALLAFDGLLWHGTWPRSAPGDRLGVHCRFTSDSRH